MSEYSIEAIRLPSRETKLRSHIFARNVLFRLLKNITIGSITIRENGETLQFGSSEKQEEPHAIVHVLDSCTWQRVLLAGSLGAGEAYMAGQWWSPDLLQVIRLFTANMKILAEMDRSNSLSTRLGLKIAHFLNNNSLNGSRRNISAHYDLGNDFFQLFLDPTMMYSAAVFPGRDSSLEQASLHKLDVLCRELELCESDHLLEIGTGWGGMAIYAAEHYGCRVTTTTISREQYLYSLERVAAEGLEDRVTVLCEDYRNLTGQYDKLVSIEMIEAVGHQYYEAYFRRCNALLKPSGLMAIQAITMVDQRYAAARDTVDFIKRYIFPGGCLPSIEVISQHLTRHTDMQMINLKDITWDYAQTLKLWRERFFAQEDAVRKQGFDDTFLRMWEFYLCYCEGGFRERVIGTVQLTFAKPGYRF